MFCTVYCVINVCRFCDFPDNVIIACSIILWVSRQGYYFLLNQHDITMLGRAPFVDHHYWLQQPQISSFPCKRNPVLCPVWPLLENPDRSLSSLFRFQYAISRFGSPSSHNSYAPDSLRFPSVEFDHPFVPWGSSSIHATQTSFYSLTMGPWIRKSAVAPVTLAPWNPRPRPSQNGQEPIHVAQFSGSSY